MLGLATWTPRSFDAWWRACLFYLATGHLLRSRWFLRLARVDVLSEFTLGRGIMQVTTLPRIAESFCQAELHLFRGIVDSKLYMKHTA